MCGLFAGGYMAISDDINLALRDFERVDAQHPAPIGDPRSGVHNIPKADLRAILLAILQTMGDPGALQTILTQISALSAGSLQRRGVVANGTSLSTITVPGIYELSAAGGYTQTPEGFDAAGLHWLIVSDRGVPAGGNARYVHQEVISYSLTDYGTTTARHYHAERRLDTQNPTATGHSAWVRMDGTTAGRALFNAADAAAQRALLGLPDFGKLTMPRNQLAAGTDLANVRAPGWYLLAANGGYGSMPPEASTAASYWLEVADYGLPNGTTGRYVFQRLYSLVVNDNGGAISRDVFTRRLDIQNPTAMGGNGRWTKDGSGAGAGGYAGKTAVFFGDSITEWNTLPNRVGARLGMSTINVGFGGTRMADHSNALRQPFCMVSLAQALQSGNWTAQDTAAQTLWETEGGRDWRIIVARLKAIDWANVSYVFIGYGTNDFGAGRALGTNADTTGATFKGAINSVLTTLMALYPHVQFVFWTPPFRARQNVGDGLDSNAHPNVAGLYLRDYADATKEAAGLYNVPVIDITRTCGLNVLNYVPYLGSQAVDGLHPNTELGWSHLSNLIADGFIARAAGHV